MRVQVVALVGNRISTYDARLDGARTRIPTPGLKDVDLVYANHGDYGYGQFLLDPHSRDFALRHPERLSDPLLRTLVLDAVWESVREAELDPAQYIELALGWLPREPDDVAAAVMLSRLRAAYLRYLSPQRRQPLAERVERFVAANMHEAKTPSRRASGRTLARAPVPGRSIVPTRRHVA